jgi:hypothetical protein
VTGSDLLSALTPVVDALDALGVRYYIGGSVASSAHGVPRASIDADVIADLDFERVVPFVARLHGAYYVDESRARAAVESRRSFNVIHLATMFKIDVFVAKGRPFDREALRRARAEALDDAPDARRFFVASPEDTILAKLEWFRAGGEVSERQWADIVGVLKMVWPQAEHEYLGRWAAALGVGDLLGRARAEADPGGG